MKLKKIHPVLQHNLAEQGLVEPTLLQKTAFGRIKGGQDFVLIAPNEEGKTTTLIMAALQRVEAPVEDMISTRVLIVVKDKFEVERLLEEFDRFGSKMGIRVFGVHDYTDLDDDKNQMSLGNDILIGTAERLNLMFSGAGFDVNQLKMYAIDDIDQQLRNRHEPRLYRLSESIGKTQRVYFATDYVEQLDMFVDKTMSEDMEWLDFYEEEEE
ncbi:MULTISPECIES: DEAD/DEAH box helicase family protein [unclassified Myroides]|uniref:DEAD/DEAH box helicase family protein n=1 Tax=unclassified Myroides TaxID=2642485 RepID=UPI0015F83D3E|nr:MULTISPECIES: DEAD/DEAH box helicase family protein [unclassified Myroides]MBB1150166.1 DEAD/DEAH box helicase family protein [Myroides sp. NP-2]MDM1408397.1 DEAD/DEAH box helicase family protein [Myroides sp. DF42-4-2]